MNLDSKSSVLMEAKKPLTLAESKKLTHCSGCDHLIGLVSTTLYEVDDKHYCSTCYSQLVIFEAAKRDHSDILKEKDSIKRTSK